MEPITTVSEIQVSYQPAIGRMPEIKCSFDAYTELLHFFDKDLLHLQEMFVVLYLNRARRVIGAYKLSKGGLVGTVADVRLILATALKTAASYMILAHNHPSGNVVPSQSDEKLTIRIAEAAKLMELSVSDHIIIGSAAGGYYSFADNGLL
ncbi:RadC family protein [Asinibacterium sp. OR53]|uniref:JAB domain-containing protein n=1 Tax=Asinibacterium sp. OR53 TaxID=925409 RepID=UPI00047C20DB|nr:JAB domain-containing protein [Asinibacterium sp. OR53]